METVQATVLPTVSNPIGAATPTDFVMSGKEAIG
jgi:hypothetical protein